jgi:ADP-ribosyl-[dinitrogen reductase] hydrolase
VIAIDRAEADLVDDLQTATGPSPEVDRADLDLRRTAGFVRVAFRLAFWHLMHTTTWRDAVVDVASRGGDADTNAAIVGALLGARDGVSALPPAWIDRVLAATQPGPPDWAEAHHPRHLLRLAQLACA